MSNIKLVKEHDGQKPGTVISVPWLKGQELMRAGIGNWWDTTTNKPTTFAEHKAAKDAAFAALKKRSGAKSAAE